MNTIGKEHMKRLAEEQISAWRWRAANVPWQDKAKAEREVAYWMRKLEAANNAHQKAPRGDFFMPAPLP